MAEQKSEKDKKLSDNLRANLMRRKTAKKKTDEAKPTK